MAKQEILLESGTNEMELLTFLLEDQPFGLNVAKVEAIVQFDTSLVSKIPQAPAALLGMLLYRDRTIPLIDLSAALNMQTTANERQIVRRCKTGRWFQNNLRVIKSLDFLPYPHSCMALVSL